MKQLFIPILKWCSWVEVSLYCLTVRQKAGFEVSLGQVFFQGVLADIPLLGSRAGGSYARIRASCWAGISPILSDHHQGTGGRKRFQGDWEEALRAGSKLVVFPLIVHLFPSQQQNFCLSGSSTGMRGYSRYLIQVGEFKAVVSLNWLEPGQF